MVNDILNGIKKDENIENNDQLKPLIQNIASTDKKLQKIIQNNEIDDEKVMQFCLELNDDCINVLKKYKDVKKGIRFESQQQKSV